LHNIIDVIAFTCPAGTGGGPTDVDPIGAPVVELVKTFTGLLNDAEFTNVVVIISISLKYHTEKQCSILTD
jgi:hypothetical protein